MGRTACVALPDGEALTIPYDHLVIAVGSVARTLPIPGLDRMAFGFRQVEDAVALRDQVLERLAAAAGMRDAHRRARALTFVFVGGGYAGIEALGELEDVARAAVAEHETLAGRELRFVLVEAADRVLPEVGLPLGEHTVARLRSRGISVRLRTTLDSCVDGRVVLSDGTSFEADTLVWTAGVLPHPVLLETGLPLDGRGRLRCTPDLRIEDDHGIVPGAWSAGDCAAVPDLTGEPGATCTPSAQHAVRQARRLADNILAVVRGGQPAPYRHRHVGSVASLGLHQGVAQLYGVRLRGRLAWYVHRAYHLSRMPTANRKLRILLDWALAALFRRDLVALGRLPDPRGELVGADEEERLPTAGVPSLTGMR